MDERGGAWKVSIGNCESWKQTGGTREGTNYGNAGLPVGGKEGKSTMGM